MIVNQEAGTRVDEVAEGIYRICTPLDIIPGGFTVNSYLIDDEEPDVAGQLVPLPRRSVETAMPQGQLRGKDGHAPGLRKDGGFNEQHLFQVTPLQHPGDAG